MSERLFSNEVKVNKYQLPEESADHAGLYHYWANALADAKSDLDDAVDKLKYCLAKTEMDIRDDWDKYSDSKLTEKGVATTLEISNTVTKARDYVRECQRNVHTLIAAESAMRHRKDMIDNLTQLLIKGFYAAPDGGKKEGYTEQTGSDVRSTLNKKEKR